MEQVFSLPYVGALYLCCVYWLQRKGVGKQCDKGPLCQFHMFAVLMYPNIQFCVIQIADEEEISCADVRCALCLSSICADVQSALRQSCVCALFTCSGWLHIHRGKGCCAACTVSVPYVQCAPIPGHCTCTGRAVLHMYCTVLHM